MCGIFGAVRLDGGGYGSTSAGGGSGGHSLAIGGGGGGGLTSVQLGTSTSTGLDVDVEAALAAIAHRGPDARGIWRGPGAVLGHTRLSIIDLTPTGAQPMLDRESQAVVVFNG